MIIATIEDYNNFAKTAKKCQEFKFKCKNCGSIVSKQYRKGRPFNLLCRSCSVKDTSIKKWGVDSPLKSDIVKNKIKKTNLDRRGVEYPAQSKEVIEKIKETNLKKYNVENVFQLDEIKAKSKQTLITHFGVEHALQNKELKEKAKNTNIKRYGVEFPQKLDVFKEKAKNTSFEKYGCYPQQLDSVKQKIATTNMEKYGAVYPAQNTEVREKISKAHLSNFSNPEKKEEILLKRTNTCIDTYGFPYASQSEEIKEKAYKTLIAKYGVGHSLVPLYSYDGLTFDSSWELAFYIFNLDAGNNISRCNTFLEYSYENIKHKYYPDFEIDGILFEIKGDQFFNENGEMICPFDSSKNGLYEAKHQCGLSNNVIFLTEKDIEPCIEYINNKLGKNWKELYKLKK